MSADWDGGRCPRCRAGTLVVEVDGRDYRYCSYVECDWGLGDDDQPAIPGRSHAEVLALAAAPQEPTPEQGT